MASHSPGASGPKFELKRSLSTKYGISQNTVKRIIDDVFLFITKRLAEGKTAEFRNFGVFRPGEIPPVKPIKLPQGRVRRQFNRKVKFIPSLMLRRAITTEKDREALR